MSPLALHNTTSTYQWYLQVPHPPLCYPPVVPPGPSPTPVLPTSGTSRSLTHPCATHQWYLQVPHPPLCYPPVVPPGPSPTPVLPTSGTSRSLTPPLCYPPVVPPGPSPTPVLPQPVQSSSEACYMFFSVLPLPTVLSHTSLQYLCPALPCPALPCTVLHYLILLQTTVVYYM